jgi:hypothetical protein
MTFRFRATMCVAALARDSGFCGTVRDRLHDAITGERR